jgi:hypothetical protein
MPDEPGGLGRRIPQNFDHVTKHRALMLTTTAPFTVNRVLKLPDLRRYFGYYDQGKEGACVGFGTSWAMTILNRALYAARHFYLHVQTVDPFDDTPPGEGTTVAAAMDVLRKVGHWRLVYDRKTRQHVITGPLEAEGIAANKWATSVDEVRASAAAGTPTIIGVNWYENFDRPVWDAGLQRWIIGRDPRNLGRIRGGHCVCMYGALDKHSLVPGINNWGAPFVQGDPTTDNLQLVSGYPRFAMPYETLDRLLREDGEVTVLTDRQGALLTPAATTEAVLPSSSDA